MEEFDKYLDIGTCMGRQQAFAALATQCSAARALCLKQARESRAFEHLGITWDRFCEDYAGLSRSRADAIIHNYDNFGDAYFRLSDITRISPETFQLVAGSIRDNVFEIDGENVPLTPEHAPQVRAAVKAARARHKPAPAADAPLTEAELWKRFQAFLAELRRAAQASADREFLRQLSYLAEDAVEALLAFAGEVQPEPEAA